MNQRFATMIAVAGIALSLGSQFSVESTIGQQKATKDAEKATPAKVASKPRGRLPQYYGQIGLSDKQRQQIYDVQANYKKQIDELQKQIDALKAKEDAEVVAVLTPEQKKNLDELLAAAKKAAEERRSKSKKKAS
jgi:Spy/CpxP family protein refolding chaperone